MVRRLSGGPCRRVPGGTRTRVPGHLLVSWAPVPRLMSHRAHAGASVSGADCAVCVVVHGNPLYSLVRPCGSQLGAHFGCRLSRAFFNHHQGRSETLSLARFNLHRFEKEVTTFASAFQHSTFLG